MNFEDDKQKNKRLSQLLSVTEKNVAGPDKEFLDKLQEKSTAEFLASSVNETKNSKTTLPIWRIIMKSNITKFAAAAIIIVVVILSISLWDKSISTAYAFEQTLEAFRDVRTIHLLGRNLRDSNFEMWVQLNSDTGMPDYCRLYTPSDNYLAVSRPDKSYQYNEKTNRVQITSGMLLGYIEFAPAYMFEELIKYSKMENTDIKVDINYEHDPESDKTLILAIYESPIEKWKISIDPDTKLPVRLNLLSETHRMGLVFKDVDEIEYNLDFPEGFFDFEIPEGAQVIEQ